MKVRICSLAVIFIVTIVTLVTVVKGSPAPAISDEISFIPVNGTGEGGGGVGDEVGNGARRDSNALGEQVTAILNRITAKYDQRVRPNYGGEPVEVGVSMYVLSISSMSEVEMDFTMDMYFRQAWNDPRLKFKGPPGIKTLSIDSQFIKTMWVPDTFFVNEKKSYFHTATKNNEFVRISENGDVFRSMRITVTAFCPMNLRHFPMDRQHCTLEIESYGYSMSDIRYKWAQGLDSVGISPDVTLPQFQVVGHRQLSSVISLSTGNYSRMACELVFARARGYYIIQIYIPSILVVFISWVSFWHNRASSPARTALGVTTVLTMVTLMVSTNSALPKVSYVKSIDIYLGSCFLFVFAALVEYAVVVYIGKRIILRKSKYESLLKQMDEDPVKVKLPHKRDLEKVCGVNSSDVDKYSRIIFPVAFFLFQLAYWTTHVLIAEHNKADIILWEDNQ